MKLPVSNLVTSRKLGTSSLQPKFGSKAISLSNRYRNSSIIRKSHHPTCRSGFGVVGARNGFTLVEMTVVIAVILVLVGAASLGIKPYYAYRDGRAAGETLRAVKAAQLMYLADNPSVAVTSLTQALLVPYMPGGNWPSLPMVGTVAPTINCAVFPPVAVLNGSTYDPTGSTPPDGLWDVGQY
jgi:prepilin-type N-terminal cleavage/methylation domain-containing protein